MDILHIDGSQVSLLATVPDRLPEPGFLWIDAAREEVAQDSTAWRDMVQAITGIHIYDPHVSDAINPSHPSYFDSSHDYAMVVFRKLDLAVGDSEPRNPEEEAAMQKVPLALTKLGTKPVTFFLMERVLVTVHAPNSRTIEAAKARLLDSRSKRTGAGGAGNRPAATPEELMLRLLNAMVDQYLELRQPLSNQVERWQHALLNPRRPFNDWLVLLDARRELRKLDELCEGQHDAVQELRDYVVDYREGATRTASDDLLLIRINDVMEHISRVLNHARRLESSIESAVQIHFSAMSHRTSEIMRTLTVITALFMPLTLITGVFGMNFDYLPLLRHPSGFWMTVGAMFVVVFGMLLFFRRKRYLEGRARSAGGE